MIILKFHCNTCTVHTRLSSSMYRCIYTGSVCVWSSLANTLYTGLANKIFPDRIKFPPQHYVMEKIVKCELRCEGPASYMQCSVLHTHTHDKLDPWMDCTYMYISVVGWQIKINFLADFMASCRHLWQQFHQLPTPAYVSCVVLWYIVVISRRCTPDAHYM